MTDTSSIPAGGKFVPDILLIDIAGLAYAALHTPLGKLTHLGKPTGAVHGALTSVFTRMNLRPGAVPFVLWDRRATWRHELYPAYKAGRHVGEEKQRLRAEYKLQVPQIQMMLSALGVPQISCGESEADDIAGVLCRELDPSWMIELVTKDTDWYQGLHGDHVAWFSPLNKAGHITRSVLADPENGLSDGHFLSPWEYLQAKALAGDSSDEIDGVQGVGLATALKYIRPYAGEITNFWAACDSGALKSKGVVMERLATAESRAIYERNIVLMDWSRAPAMRHDLVSLSCGAADWTTAQGIAEEHGLAKMMKLGRTTLAPWSKGWDRTTLSAVDAALHSHRYQAVMKHGAAVPVEIVDDSSDRQSANDAELKTIGYRMESSLCALAGGGDGHAVNAIDQVDDDVLHANPQVLALAEEWSRIENATIRSQRTHAAGEEQPSGRHERPSQA